jgi:hypothetical protein
MTEQYNEGGPFLGKRQKDETPKAPSIGKRYASRLAGKYGDVQTHARMAKINTAGGKSRRKR